MWRNHKYKQINDNSLKTLSIKIRSINDGETSNERRNFCSVENIEAIYYLQKSYTTWWFAVYSSLGLCQDEREIIKRDFISKL